MTTGLPKSEIRGYLSFTRCPHATQTLLYRVSVGVSAVAFVWPSAAQKPDKAKEPIPHGQDQLPGPPLSPQEAIKKMTVPDGFRVELVAAEPDIVNPVAMTFDERGRIWITESLEYPRRSAGPGRDRIKVLEDTKGDGKYDKITVFAEGLNIPSGIAVGHGGVWVANSPDILFYKTGPDGKAAGKPEVVVTGFGRDDTHELPNSLTWGPDGWLYGLNGVFNHSPRQAATARTSTSPAPCSASIRRRANSSSSARAPAIPGASPGTTRAAPSSAPASSTTSGT